MRTLSLLLFLSFFSCKDQPNEVKVIKKSMLSAFFKEQNEQFVNSRYYVKNDTIFEKKRNIGIVVADIPNYFKQDTSYVYHAKNGDVAYRMEILQLNSTDIKYQIDAMNNGKLSSMTDTVTLHGNRNNYSSSSIDYRKVSQLEHHTLNVGRNQNKLGLPNEFINFRFWSSHSVGLKSKDDPFYNFSDRAEQITTFRLESRERPYSKILKNLLAEGQYYHKTSKGKEELELVLSEITEYNLEESIIVDSNVLGSLISSGATDLLSKVNHLGYVTPELASRNLVQTVPVSKMDRLTGTVRVRYSERFEDYNFRNEEIGKKFMTRQFYSSPSMKNDVFLTGDKLYKLFYGYGEMTSSILTMWSKIDTAYTLLEIFEEQPGIHHIDTVFVHNHNTYIIGYKDTGEGGDMWGNVSILELVHPRKYKSVYSALWECHGYEDEDEDDSYPCFRLKHKVYSDRLQITKLKDGIPQKTDIVYFHDL